jgi:hypothetical protein
MILLPLQPYSSTSYGASHWLISHLAFRSPTRIPVVCARIVTCIPRHTGLTLAGNKSEGFGPIQPPADTTHVGKIGFRLQKIVLARQGWYRCRSCSNCRCAGKAARRMAEVTPREPTSRSLLHYVGQTGAAIGDVGRRCRIWACPELLLAPSIADVLQG